MASLFVIYEGDPSNPLDQQMRAVEGDDLASVAAQHPHAIMVQAYQEPKDQDRPPLKKLALGMPVWAL